MFRPPCIIQGNTGTDGQSSPGMHSRLGSQEDEDTPGTGPSQRQQGSPVPPPANHVTRESDGTRSPSPPSPSPAPRSPSPSAGMRQPASSPPPPPKPLKRRPKEGDTGDSSREEDPHNGSGPQKRQRIEQAKVPDEAPVADPPQVTDGKAGKSKRSAKPKRPPTQPKVGQGKRHSTRASKAAVKKCEFLF